MIAGGNHCRHCNQWVADGMAIFHLCPMQPKLHQPDLADIRRIVREEIEAALARKQIQEQAQAPWKPPV